AQATTQRRKAPELETLKKGADSAKNLYEVLLQKLNETDIAQSIRSNNVTLVDQASPPRAPVRPAKRKIGAAGLLLGLLAGLGVLGVPAHLPHNLPPPPERA